MAITDKLIEARNYIADPENWIKGSLNRDTKVCSIGAIAMVADSKVETMVMEDYLDRAIAFLHNEGRLERRVVSFNDGKADHSGIVEVFDTAIQIAKNEDHTPIPGDV